MTPSWWARVKSMLLRAFGISKPERLLANAAKSAAMRQALVDRARSRRAKGWNAGIEPIPLSMDDPSPKPLNLDAVLLLDEYLTCLAKVDARIARSAEMRFFLGLSAGEIAADLGASSRTVKGDLAMAAAWLKTEMAARRKNE